jgi:hydroxyethylthiazole kinase-like uncharacterized protein yjeF
MRPVVTVAEMRAIDAAAREPAEVLIGRAGRAVAQRALQMLGSGYGRRVVVVAGKGNNGADGRAAASRLRRRGALVTVVDAASGLRALPPSDLVVDAAYGTGFHGDYWAPDPGGAPVLAVDIPSGVAGDTGACGDGAVVADATVTFAALKPGLLLGAGAERAGAISVADIGLGVYDAHIHLVSDGDVVSGLPRRRREAHKWQSAVLVVAGSPGMLGAPSLASTAALRAGSGYVRLGVPGGALSELPRAEAVGVSLPAEGWDAEALVALERCRALVVGPGLGRSEATAAAVRRLVARAPVPVVVDADGLYAIGGREELARICSEREQPTVVTPHDGEFARLAGGPPGEDRIAAATDLASTTGAVVLLKGSTTIVADGRGAGRVLLAAAGSARLATAGTGDVLSGIIGALLAQGLGAPEATAFGAHLHGAAAQRGHAVGLVAGDLPDLVATWLSEALTRG